MDVKSLILQFENLANSPITEEKPQNNVNNEVETKVSEIESKVERLTFKVQKVLDLKTNPVGVLVQAIDILLELNEIESESTWGSKKIKRACLVKLQNLKQIIPKFSNAEEINAVQECEIKESNIEQECEVKEKIPSEEGKDFNNNRIEDLNIPASEENVENLIEDVPESEEGEESKVMVTNLKKCFENPDKENVQPSIKIAKKVSFKKLVESIDDEPESPDESVEVNNEADSPSFNMDEGLNYYEKIMKELPNLDEAQIEVVKNDLEQVAKLSEKKSDIKKIQKWLATIENNMKIAEPEKSKVDEDFNNIYQMGSTETLENAAQFEAIYKSADH